VGEIDIICKKCGKIVFVEVKTRGSNMFGTPEDAITAHKKQKLAMMAYQYLQQKKLQNCNFSVDGVFIDMRGHEYEIRHLENILEN
jgi:putative endonuclease